MFAIVHNGTLIGTRYSLGECPEDKLVLQGMRCITCLYTYMYIYAHVHVHVECTCMHVHCIYHVRVVTCVTRLCHEQWSPAVCVSHGPALSPRQPGHTVSPHSVWPGWHWSALLGEGSPAGRWAESERG